jgi:hypothetical protein
MLYLATALTVATCTGETKAAIALGVSAAFTCINSQITSRVRRSGRRTIRADDIAAVSRLPCVHISDIFLWSSVSGERKALPKAGAVSLQPITLSVGDFVVNERRGQRAQSIRLIFELNEMHLWYQGAPQLFLGNRSSWQKYDRKKD